MKFSSMAIAFLATAALAPVAANAAKITYTYTSTFFGTVDGDPYNSVITFTGIGDTNNTTIVLGGVPAVVLTSLIADASGNSFAVGTPSWFGFTNGIAGFVFADSIGGFVFSAPVLVGYDGVSNIMTETSPADGGTASFASGSHAFVLAGQSPGTFTATVTSVPEPATWALMIGGFAITGVAMRRRKVALAA